MQSKTSIDQSDATVESAENRHAFFFHYSENAWDRVLEFLAFISIGSYLLLYVLIPDAYAFGPMLLLLVALFGFRWRKMLHHVDDQSRWLISVLLLYFLGQTIPLIIHGEDISEFDLSARYIAASLVLLVVLKYTISARWFFSLAATGALVAGIFAFYQAEFLGVSRVTAFDNPIHYGNGAMAMALLAMAAIGWAMKQNYRFFWIALLFGGFVGGMYASLMSATRSGWVAIPIIVLTGLYVYWQPLLRRKVLSLVLLMVVVVGVGSVSQVDLVERRAAVAIDEFVDYYEENRNDTSVGLRLDMWKAGWLAFQENLLIGVGPAGTDAVVDKLVLSEEIHPAVQNFRHLHNQYIDNLARYGLIGLICYLLLLAVPFVLFLKKTRSDVTSVQALALGGCFFVELHAVVNLTQSMLERNIGVMMFALMIVFIWGAIRGEEVRTKDESEQEIAGRSHNVTLD
jgi:O-antigen ligase